MRVGTSSPLFFRLEHSGKYKGCEYGRAKIIVYILGIFALHAQGFYRQSHIYNIEVKSLRKGVDHRDGW